MFTHARFKLTAWYLLIIAVITIAFSLVVYRFISLEINRFGEAQQLRFQRRIFDEFGIPPPPIHFDPELLFEAKHRVLIMLGLIDLSILTGSAVAGFFLAGRTLHPIAEMVAEQNRFISDSSHELRTPLTSLKSEIEVNLRDKHLSLSGAKELLTSNLEEVNRLAILSDDLIKLAQYRKLNQSFPKEICSTADLVSAALKQISGLAKAKQITLTTLLTDTQILGSKPALIETLVIFLDNAIKYSPPKTTITISSIKTSHHTEIKISDQGIGIDPADLPHIFDRFYRGSKSRTITGLSGYGLGLSIAKEIIDHHHGTVKVTSSPQLGTTFTIKL